VRADLAITLATAVLCTTATAAAAPEPSRAHPRLFLDDKIRATWKKQVGKDSAIAAAIGHCNASKRGGRDYTNDRYMGFQWSSNLQACLIAWAATGEDDHAKVAVKWFDALLDDLENVGDGRGGDNTIRRDSGYAIRLIGPTTALAYDWLHDHPAMGAARLAKARGRFKAWLDWYIKDGYRPRSPSTNYHAGYLVAATFIAIAQAGDAGADGTKLWKHVVDELWRGDMVKALTGKGPLVGGDWGEGWQYAPLSVAGYALAGRAMQENGVEIDGLTDWLTALVVRHVHALSPGGQWFVGGDTQNRTPNIDVAGMGLLAVLVGKAPDEARGWAMSEILRMRLTVGDEFRLYDAIAADRPWKQVEVPRKDWPTWYYAGGTGNLYARGHWGKDAIWTVMQCTSTIDIDHFHPNAGNFVLSRGKDDVIADPSPYGTLSTLTSNAPTVESAHLPDDYKPGQAFWSVKTRWDWAHQTKGGVVVGRCDYADQYKFQDRPSDVPAAVRDLVVVPWADGADASVVVIDRAKSGDARRGLHLKFRTPGTLALDGDVATATVGSSGLSIRRLVSSSGKPALGRSQQKDCFSAPATRGNCDAGRFPVTDLRLVVDGPAMEAVHVIDATGKGAGAVTATLEKGTGWQGVWLERKTGDGAAMVVYGAPAKTLSYTAPAKRAHHVVVDAPADKGKATVTATKEGAGCKVSISPGGAMSAKPVVFTLDDQCAVTDDGVMTGGPTLGGSPVAAVTGGDDDAGGGGDDGGAPGSSGASASPATRDPSGPRTGCCGAQSTPGSSIALGVVVLGILFGLRRRR
jgi:MYXO-CTERM domain-containing protein